MADDTWTQAAAIALCVEIEAVCPKYGCHVALTGGTLYKEGERKDVDVLFYRIRQKPKIDEKGLFGALTRLGIDLTARHGWVQKATYRGKGIDFFFPEYNDHDNDLYPTR